MADGDNFRLYSRILFKNELLFKRKTIVNFKDSEDHECCYYAAIEAFDGDKTSDTSERCTSARLWMYHRVL